MATFELRAGDTNPSIEYQLTRRDGTLQPLTGSETGSLILSDWYGTDKLTKSITVSDAVNSKVKATFTSGDTTPLKGMVLRGRSPVALAGGTETFPTAPDELLVVVY